MYDTATQTFTGIPAVGMTCWCGISFAIPETLHNEYRRQNDAVRGSMSLNCPLGHSMVPAGLSRAAIERDAAQRRADYWAEEARQMGVAAERARRSAAASRGVVTKLKRRLGKGVCPCCRRYFADLHRHVQGQHPDFVADSD